MMMVCVPHEELTHFEHRLRERKNELRAEIDTARANKRSNTFTRMAGEAHDLADASLPTITLETANAEIRRDENELRQVEEALGRITAGGYGVCLRCGECLDRARLEAYPAASRHSECQEAHDREAARMTQRIE